MFESACIAASPSPSELTTDNLLWRASLPPRKWRGFIGGCIAVGRSRSICGGSSAEQGRGRGREVAAAAAAFKLMYNVWVSDFEPEEAVKLNAIPAVAVRFPISSSNSDAFAVRRKMFLTAISPNVSVTVMNMLFVSKSCGGIPVNSRESFWKLVQKSDIGCDEVDTICLRACNQYRSHAPERQRAAVEFEPGGKWCSIGHCSIVSLDSAGITKQVIRERDCKCGGWLQYQEPEGYCLLPPEYNSYPPSRVPYNVRVVLSRFNQAGAFARLYTNALPSPDTKVVGAN
ncbi:hypothetical protein KCU92_g347, partial [Aureobasidium melanogenum]